jgi:hypothetical protein
MHPIGIENNTVHPRLYLHEKCAVLGQDLSVLRSPFLPWANPALISLKIYKYPNILGLWQFVNENPNVNCWNTRLTSPFFWEVTSHHWMIGTPCFDTVWWSCVSSSKVRPPCCFETSGISHPVMRRHIQEQQRLLFHRSKFHCIWHT